MGLAIEVGMLADLNVNDEEGAEWLRESLARVNEVLVENGFSPHAEPETLPIMSNRASVGSFPYSFLHYLRRVAAHVSRNADWKIATFAETDNPADDPIVTDASAMLDSHLLCHSDCEGFYVPIDFPNPIFADEDRIPGAMLGSSQALMRELIAVAPSLGIGLSAGRLSDEEAARIDEIVETEGPFWIEHMVWISLFEAARLSIEHKTAICFS
jgi:hypothetical protein